MFFVGIMAVKGLRKGEFPYWLIPSAPAMIHAHAPFNVKSGPFNGDIDSIELGLN